jgi:hypothetical protein
VIYLWLYNHRLYILWLYNHWLYNIIQFIILYTFIGVILQSSLFIRLMASYALYHTNVLYLWLYNLLYNRLYILYSRLYNPHIIIYNTFIRMILHTSLCIQLTTSNTRQFVIHYILYILYYIYTSYIYNK